MLMSELFADTLSALPLRPRVEKRSSARESRWGDRVIDQELFKSVLVRERKLSDRFEQPFVLVLVTMTAAGDVDERKWEPVIEALSAAKRETDVIGWFESLATIGVILPETDASDPAVATEMVSRVRQELAARVDADAPISCVTKIHSYSGRFDGREKHTADPLTCDRPARWWSVAKRVIDVMGSLALLALFSPLLLLLTVLVKLTSRGPVFFRQPRIGQYGKVFTMLKFRTMHADASEPLHQEFVKEFISARARPSMLGEDEVFKLVDDPRVTRFGKWLRRTSLDEMPQFWNVLTGSMSLVGPRPPLHYEVEQYKSWHYRRILEAKPGITGLWQVTGRNRTSFDDMVRLDLRYARSRSLLTDLRILLATPRAVLSRKGAC
jgi:lipopolysaccharide/colanic/teichoic acid biosynthesis glycosyltransferase